MGIRRHTTPPRPRRRRVYVKEGYNSGVKHNIYAQKYIIGIDEVGRGPLAGPVTVGAVLLQRGLGWRHFKGLRDSKKLTKESREVWFAKALDMNIPYAVSSVSQRIIDTKGIVPSIHIAIYRCLNKLKVHPKKCLVLLDGGLHAPEEFIYQKTIIRGDEKECAIALASVMAKVTRDRKMVRLSKKYPEYGFETHKGYGTKRHYKQIKKYGICELHRRSFLRGVDCV